MTVADKDKLYSSPTDRYTDTAYFGTANNPLEGRAIVTAEDSSEFSLTKDNPYFWFGYSFFSPKNPPFHNYQKHPFHYHIALHISEEKASIPIPCFPENPNRLHHIPREFVDADWKENMTCYDLREACRQAIFDATQIQALWFGENISSNPTPDHTRPVDQLNCIVFKKEGDNSCLKIKVRPTNRQAYIFQKEGFQFIFCFIYVTDVDNKWHMTIATPPQPGTYTPTEDTNLDHPGFYSLSLTDSSETPVPWKKATVLLLTMINEQKASFQPRQTNPNANFFNIQHPTLDANYSNDEKSIFSLLGLQMMHFTTSSTNKPDFKEIIQHYKTLYAPHE